MLPTDATPKGTMWKNVVDDGLVCDEVLLEVHFEDAEWSGRCKGSGCQDSSH